MFKVMTHDQTVKVRNVAAALVDEATENGLTALKYYQQGLEGKIKILTSPALAAYIHAHISLVHTALEE